MYTKLHQRVTEVEHSNACYCSRFLLGKGLLAEGHNENCSIESHRSLRTILHCSLSGWLLSLTPTRNLFMKQFVCSSKHALKALRRNWVKNLVSPRLPGFHVPRAWWTRYRASLHHLFSLLLVFCPSIFSLKDIKMTPRRSFFFRSITDNFIIILRKM